MAGSTGLSLTVLSATCSLASTGRQGIMTTNNSTQAIIKTELKTREHKSNKRRPPGHAGNAQEQSRAEPGTHELRSTFLIFFHCDCYIELKVLTADRRSKTPMKLVCCRLRSSSGLWPCGLDLLLSCSCSLLFLIWGFWLLGCLDLD